jgi:hypothetical protein
MGLAGGKNGLMGARWVMRGEWEENREAARGDRQGAHSSETLVESQPSVMMKEEHIVVGELGRRYQ